MRLAGRASGVAVAVFLFGLVLGGACAAGIADVADHGSRAIGAGTITERYTVRRCAGRSRCTRYKVVRVTLDGAKGSAEAGSDELYAQVGPEGRQLRIERGKVDTFNDRISELVVGGRTYVTYDQGAGILWVVVPLALLALGLMLWGLPGTLGVIARRLPGRTQRKRWIRAGVGVIGGILTVIFCVVGMTGSTYDLGPGELYDRWAELGGRDYHDGAHVRTSFGTTEKVESAALYDLLGERSTLPVHVLEDDAGEIVGVRYEGKSFSTVPPNWLPLIVFVPLGLYLLALGFVNLRLIVQRPTTPSGLPGAA